VGPDARDFECTLGLQCSIALSGYRIANTSAVVVLESGECGDVGATIATHEGFTDATANSTFGSNATYKFGRPDSGLAGSSYKLCWGHEPNAVADYSIEIDGDAELIGPFTRTFDCTLGLACSVLLEGYRLAATNQLVAITSGACGDADMPGALAYANETWDKASASSPGGYTFITANASAPMLEAGTGFHTDIRPAVFAEIQTAKRNSLSSVKTNDRSSPVIEKWVHIDTAAPPARKSLVEEIKEKRKSIEALASYNEHKSKEEIEKYTRPDLMDELKSYKGYIEEKNEWNSRNSKAELSKKVNNDVVAEIQQKRQSITEFTAYAAANQSADNFRAQSRPSLVSEIKQKRDSINALTQMHNQNSGRISVS
jgi:hypothetical protein